MVRNFVHWGHAKWAIIHKYGIENEELAKCAYSVALKLAHPDDPRTATAFERDTEDLARVSDSWQNLRSSFTYPNTSIQPLLACLPVCQVLTDDGTFKPKASTVAYMTQGHDLSKRGYNNVEVVNGYRFTERHLPQPSHTLVSNFARGLQGLKSAPKYQKKCSVEEAKRRIEEIFPGIDWRAVYSLLCASGCAQETKLGTSPMLFIAGPSGSAKTVTCRVAAGIMGSEAPEVTYKQDDEKLKQNIREAGQRGAMVVANEFLKDAARAMRRHDPRAAMETLLTMTPSVRSWVLYVGPKEMGRVPSLVLTEPKCPHTLRAYTQIGRRVRYLQLAGRKKIWVKKMAEHKVASDSIHLFRRVSTSLAEAADAILADVTDRFFSEPMAWDAMADSLGALTIETHPEFPDPDPEAKKFFALVCSAPELSDPRLKKGYGRGYKLIHRINHPTTLDEDLCAAYNFFADHDDWGHSKLLDERDWSGLLDVPEPVTLDLGTDGNAQVFARFRMGGTMKKPGKVNGEIADLSHLLTGEEE
jgi:hypothetical protein